MCDPATIGAAINIGAPIAGDMLKGDSAQKMAEYKQNVMMKAYNEMLNRAKEGETSFLAETAPDNPVTARMQDQIRGNAMEGQQDAANQMRANLAQKGVRGGQAATLLNRGTGDLARKGLQDVNQLGYQNLLTRQNYFANKAKGLGSTPPVLGA
jgi:hypothetical protein